MPLAPDWPLTTERLLVRPFESGDFEALHAMHADAGVARWLYNEPRDAAGSRELLDLKIAGSAFAGEGDWLSGAVVLGESGEVVGDLALHWVSEPYRTVEIGFVLDPRHQGRGYATEAARELLRVAFEQFEMHRAIGRCEARNTGSVRVLEKLGMRREAHLVENELVKGEWQSELVYALLDREWQARS
ncbi:MAG: GNAT family N-acetyltransferase [Gaiellaceae bacterium]